MSILRKHHFLNNCKIIWPQNKRVNLSWTELYLFSSRIWLMSADITVYACMCHLQRKTLNNTPKVFIHPRFDMHWIYKRNTCIRFSRGKTGCDQLKGTCIKWPNIWSFDNDTWRRESPAWYPKEAKRTTMKLYHTGQGIETCTSTCTALLWLWYIF